MTQKDFQFTTSQGGRRCTSLMAEIAIALSIHDLSRRSTFPVLSRTHQYPSFNSRPLKEVDRQRPDTKEHQKPFNSRPLKEVDLALPRNTVLSWIFQFTTSQGGRHLRYDIATLGVFFQFTTSQGGRPLFGSICVDATVFQFTTSQGGRHICDRKENRGV